MRLILGVVDVPYAAVRPATTATPKMKQVPKPPSGAGQSITTGDVAQILEARYSVMGTFYEMHSEDIAKALEETMQGKLENLMMGGPVSDTLFNEGDLSQIEEDFRKFLDNKEMDGRVAGVPTQASLQGVNHRLQRPYVRRGARPSFIDTGMFSDSFKAWVEE